MDTSFGELFLFLRWILKRKTSLRAALYCLMIYWAPFSSSLERQQLSSRRYLWKGRSIVYSSYSMRDIHEHYCLPLAKQPCDYKYDHARCKKTGNILAAAKAEGPTIASTVHNIHDEKLLEDGCCMVMFERENRERSEYMLNITMEWARLWFRCKWFNDFRDKATLLAHAVKQSKTCDNNVHEEKVVWWKPLPAGQQMKHYQAIGNRRCRKVGWIESIRGSRYDSKDSSHRIKAYSTSRFLWTFPWQPSACLQWSDICYWFQKASGVMKCRRIVCICSLKTNEKYDHIACFCIGFLIRVSHTVNMFFSIPPVLFLHVAIQENDGTSTIN